MEGIGSIRGVFQKELIVALPDGFSVLWPSVGDGAVNETTECIEDGNLDILRKLTRVSESIQITYTDGVSAGIRFNIPGFSDRAAIYAPVKRELTPDELQDMISEAEKLDDCPEFIEVFSDVDMGNAADVARGYLDFWKIMNKQEAFDLSATINWHGFVACARKLKGVFRDFEYEERPPNDMGLCYVTFSGPMYDDTSGFSITLRGREKDALSELLETSSECDIVFCCCDEYSGIDLTFFA